MVWMPLVKNNSMRRRKSQSPSSSSESSPTKLFTSKNKRRIFRKRDSSGGVTEVSSLSSKWSIRTDGALWRVENIREGPPTADEWWKDDGAPDTIDVYHEVEDDKNGPDGSRKVVINTHVSTSKKKFHNCGYETWIRAREEWKQQTVEAIPERPELSDRSQIMKGLRRATSQRTYELPRNIALPDLIHMYSDIWDSGH